MAELLNVLHDVRNRTEFREWLSENHSKETECWIFVKRSAPKDGTVFFGYIDAIEEALCFGWIEKCTENWPCSKNVSPKKEQSMV